MHNNLLFSTHVASTVRRDAQEHTEVGRKTSELGKWDHPRSTLMQHWLIYLASHPRVDVRLLLCSDMVGWFLKETVPQKRSAAYLE